MSKLLKDAEVVVTGSHGDLIYRRSLAAGIAWRCANDGNLRGDSDTVAKLCATLCNYLNRCGTEHNTDHETLECVIASLTAICLDDTSSKESYNERKRLQQDTVAVVWPMVAWVLPTTSPSLKYSAAALENIQNCIFQSKVLPLYHTEKLFKQRLRLFCAALALPSEAVLSIDTSLLSQSIERHILCLLQSSINQLMTSTKSLQDANRLALSIQMLLSTILKLASIKLTNINLNEDIPSLYKFNVSCCRILASAVVETVNTKNQGANRDTNISEEGRRVFLAMLTGFLREQSLRLDHYTFREKFPGMTFALLLIYLTSSTQGAVYAKNARATLNLLMSRPRRAGGLNSAISLLLNEVIQVQADVWMGSETRGIESSEKPVLDQVECFKISSAVWSGQRRRKKQLSKRCSNTIEGYTTPVQVCLTEREQQHLLNNLTTQILATSILVYSNHLELKKVSPEHRGQSPRSTQSSSTLRIIVEACLQALTRAAVDMTDQGEPECPEAASAVLRLVKACPAIGQYLLDNKNSGLSSRDSPASGTDNMNGLHALKLNVRQSILEMLQGKTNETDNTLVKANRRHMPRRPATGVSGRIRHRMVDRKFVRAGIDGPRRTVIEGRDTRIEV